MDPERGAREFLIVENRFRTDRTTRLPDRGLGVWHIIEDPAFYGSLIPPRPPNPPASSRQDFWEQKWALIRGERLGAARDRDDWAGVGHLPSRPVVWVDSDPATGYDLLPCASAQDELALGGRHAHGFAIRHISPAGPLMSADLRVPW